MASEQSVSELTTRDVLHQIDRRLTLIEEDQRALSEKFDSRFDAAEQKTDARFDAADRRVTHVEDNLRRELNNRFYWLIGLFFAGWVTIIGAILFKS